MKGFAVIALLPFAFALVQRQAATPPPCAVGCLADASLNPAPCSATDFVCLCTNAELQTKITACLTSACTPDQIAIAATFLQDTCRQAGAPVPSVPAALGGASASASASASSVAASPSASVASAASSISAAASSASASASGAASSASASVSSIASAASSAAASASSKSGAQPTGLAKGFAAVGLGAAVGVLGMM
ncbi:uncharacterized protein MKK02DRAFT_29394 [Dioszegia hungarica]|uniref:CFEM domain-containing protein n=1 Tax=Dioszegia hungarica TaxID=4972 RepID=A0AA38LYR0_9TREE|nr:uncharacterized protein MKK02DRAFT_29394 [Dioszegia hungarica]KAI9639299.1 hypothetical protein MKK02DRAFT_29394 [Dioszegia hungarica]